MANKQKQHRSKRSIWVDGDYCDYSMLFIVIFLVCFGLVMIYSTSSYKGSITMNDPAYWFKKQAIWIVIGIISLWIFSKIDYHIYKNFTWLIYGGMIFLQVAVLVVGVERNGSKRWLGVGSLVFQPSELAKLGLVLFMAHLVSAKAKEIKKMFPMLLTMAVALPIIALIATENLSTAIVCMGIVAVIIFVASPKYLQFISLIAMGGAAAGFFLLTAGYRMERIEVWLNPEAHEKGYQTMQALYAIGSGGIFGKGLGQSMQKLGFIPESHNDMIFSVICEELGLFGAVCVIAVFFMLIWRFMIIATNAPDLYGALIAVGGLAHISIQVLINIAVVTNTIPPTGIPLPFISYGGASVVFTLVEMGIVLSVSRQIKLYQ